MLRSMFSAISGMKAHQTMLDVVSNDIANVNTVGYKSSRTSFSDSLSQLQRGATAPGAGQGGANAVQVGLGVRLGSIDKQMGSGTLQSTGNVLDVAIQGDGWYRVGASNNSPPTLPPTSTEYTRAGNFQRNQAGYLVTPDGYHVMGRTVAGGGVDTYLTVPNGSTDLQIGQDGSVSYTPAGGGPKVTAGYISLAKFSNEAGLEQTSSNRWRVSANSGPEQVNTPGGNYGLAVSGTLEMSNVDLATQFTNMIAAQRGFQANSRAISVGDDMLEELVNLKR